MDRLLIEPNGRGPGARNLRPEIERPMKNQLCAVT
jgi:hypothetical protein